MAPHSDMSEDRKLRHYKTCIHGIKRQALGGPGVTRYDSFDPLCVFGNNVSLDHAQVAYLKKYCAKREPTMSLYVCTMLKSHVIARKGKMYFNKNYTMTYLKQYLTSATKVMVSCNKKPIAEVKIKLDKGRGKRAMLTSLWLHVVEGQGFREGDVIIFWFRHVAADRLRLIVEKIESCKK